ncbi:unnamed protein product [Closterium sp. NIES-54]
MAGLINFARGVVVTPDDPDLRAEFRAVQLLTFMVISRCCSPGVQIALKWCREYLDAGHQAWHFIESTYQVTDDLLVVQLEGQLTHLRMGDEETATDYCNRTRRILATIRMAGAQYSTTSYVTHVMQGLSSNYNLLKRLSMAPGTRTTLNEDNLTSYILQDEAMQEAQRSQELLAQANFAAPTKQGGRPGQRGQSGGGGSSGWKLTKEVDKKKPTKDSGRGGGGRRRECWLCGDPYHLSFECPDRSDSDDDDTKGGRGRSGSRRPRRGGNQPRKEKMSTTTSTSAKDADSSAGGKVRDDKTASCSLVGAVEPTVLLAPEAGEDFPAVTAAVQANPAVVLLDSGCSHHLMGTKEVFVDLQPSGSIKHVRGFNGALQDVQGRGTVALQGEAGKRVLIPDVLYVPGVRANLLSSGQLKEHGVKLQEDGDGMLLVSAAGEVLGRATYSGRVLYTDLRPCPTRSTSPAPEVVALRAIVTKTKSTPDRMHARLAHVGMDTIRSSAKNEVAIGLDLESAAGADSPCVSCVGGKLARHTFPDQGSDADDVLAVVHIDLPVAKKSDVLLEFQKWLVLVERQTKKSVLQLRSDRGGEFLGKKFTDFVDGQGIVHDLTCPYTPQQNGMAEREMRTVVESVRTMLLHMGVQHHWWHLALRQAVWVRNCLERSTLPSGTTPYQLLTGQRPDLSLARIWGCMTQFLVPEQQRGGKLKPKARWGLHLGVSVASKGWELLDVDANRVVTTSDVVFYEAMSWAEWKSEHGPVSGRTPSTPPTDTSSATLPLLAEVGELAAEDVKDVSPPTPPSTAPAPPLLADLRGLTSVSASGDEGSSGPSPLAPHRGLPVKEQQPTGEQAAVQPTTEQSATEHSAGKPTTGERSGRKPTVVQQDDEGSEAGDAGESTKSDVVEVRPEPRKSDRVRRPPEFFVPAAFTTVYDVDDDDDLLYDDAEEDEEFPELDPDMLADPEHRWDILTMTVKEALASWKGPAVKAAMEEEIRSLINMGTWELVERPPGVNIMKNRWVLTTKYHVDDTVEREKARLVVKGFTQVYDADYAETFAPVGSYVTLRIFLSIAVVLNLNLMQLDMKNAFLQSKLDRVLYMSQPDYFNDGTGRVCKLLKSLYGLKQSPLLWYLALNDVLVGAGWKKSQVDEALYFKVGKDGVACWVLVYVDDLLAASSSTEMLKELKELLGSAFELREISLVQKYLGLEIVRDRSAGKLWLHQQGYADKLRRRFIDEGQTGRTPKMPVSVDAYAELTFDDEEAQERQEEVYRQKVGLLHFAATTTRPDVAFACNKLGSGLTVRSDQHWREVDRCLAYLANTRDTALEFSGGPESLELVSYVDADDAGDKQNRTSTGSYVFVYGGAAVSWSSQRIKCAMFSSTESEYVAATEAGKEGRRLRFLLAEFQQLDAGKPTILRVDNKSAITVAEGMGLTGNLKHMERRQAWLQHMVKRGKFSLRYIPTAEQPADFLTKALHYPAFNRCSVPIGQSLFSRHLLRPVVSRVLTSVVIDPRASPSSVSTLTAAITDFASTRRLDFATRVVAAPPARPEAAGGGFALGCDVLEDRQFELDFLADASPSLCAMLLSPEGDPDALDIPTLCTYREAVSGEWASQWKAAMDSELASWRSTGTYVDAVSPPKANVVDGMWLFKHSLDFSTTFLQGHLHEEIWLRRPPGFTDTFPPGTQWSLRRPVYGLRQSPREWHDTLRSTLRNLGFRPSSADPSLFVRTGSTPFFILVYVDDLVFATPDRAAQAEVLRQFGFQFSTTQPTPLVVDQRLTDPFPDEPFESSGPYAKLVGCLMMAKYLATTSGMGLVLGGTQPVELTGHCDSSYADDAETQRSTRGAEIYAGAMAAQELRWLTFLLADLGERPRSAPTLYADNKVMILLCR